MKHLFFCIALFFGVCTSAQAAPDTGVSGGSHEPTVAAGSQNSRPTVWVALPFPKSRGWDNVAQYNNGDGCVVGVDYGDSRVNLSAFESNNNKTNLRSFRHSISIKEVAGGGVEKTEVYETTTADDGNSLNIDGYTHRDHFGEKCALAAKELPESVKEKVHGFYGLGRPSRMNGR